MRESIESLYNYRGLLWAFTVRNIMMKYKQTVMGFLWALFMPMVIVLSGVVVKVAMAKFSGKSVELSSLASVMVKSLPWAFFVGALKFSVNSLVGNINIFTKIYFPRVIFPLSYVIGQLFDFCIAAVIFIVVLVFVHVGVSIYLLWLPLLLLFMILFTAGLGILFSCANLFFRDFKYIIDVLLTFGIFFTPVYFEAKLLGRWAYILLLNPIGSILEGINDVVVLHQAPETGWFLYAGVVSIATFVGSWILFHKVEPLFAEKA
ncbi:MAG: ABC transporter permease [Candidatus Omnitrophica bacterium]|nr:ABC transporter permease [Candidatus Omnitrophota bacterium]